MVIRRAHGFLHSPMDAADVPRRLFRIAGAWTGGEGERMDFDDAVCRIETRPALLRGGMTRRDIATLSHGDLRKLARGTFVASETWDAAWPAERHLLQVAAYEQRRRGGVVYSHLTAALLHGLPLWGAPPTHVHVSGTQHNGAVSRGTPYVSRHRCAVPDVDVVSSGGLVLTAPARTVADVLRTTPRDTAIAIADAALRAVAWDARQRLYDADAAEYLRAEIARRLTTGARGVRQARELLELADGRSESAGESVSRLRLHDLGFRRIRLQVSVGPYFVDFGLDDAAVWGEYDGEVKYRDVAMRHGRALEDVLRAEKEREDWIRGLTGRRVIRWTTADIRSPGGLRSKLYRFGVFPTPNHRRNAESPPDGAHSGGDGATEW
ncbi:hypothetical protein AB0P19_10845 [Microbacterium oleivorans]|uniref:hypothetical protein n=2 Tax=Microbacterium oleivorans TaxID=273677 RepID=UPI003443BD68